MPEAGKTQMEVVDDTEDQSVLSAGGGILIAHPARTALDEMPLLLPVPRAAQLLGISRSAAYRCAATGELPTTHLGGRVYVVTEKLQTLLDSA